MGVVFRARDLAMNRDVAVKILQSRFSPESAIGLRFIEEARITGQLQHPGIPPVHQVGTLPDGRPFLAMKLIKGSTLDELLKNRGDPGSERGRFLAVFEQVAQAVGYAHAHNVIHRDLKPANIMVGSFGEVQVMDWGLAKVLTATDQDETLVPDSKLGTEIRSLRDDATQAGSLLGTPAYMPPEQAIGALDQISPRSDVFGLGGLLCVILTGEPPFVSDSSEGTRLKAARGKLDEAFARLDGCGAEPELIALAKRCLAPDPAERPRDAGEVAQAITALRADAERRARQLEMERARDEVRLAEEGKRRRVKVALLITFFILLAVGGFAAWGIESIRAERNEERLKREADQKAHANELQTRQLATERDVIAALNEAQVLRKAGWEQNDDTARWALTLGTARSSFKRAQVLLSSGDSTDELRARVSAMEADLAQDERDRELLAKLDKIEEESDIRFFIPVMLTGKYAQRYALAFREYGVDLLALPRAQAVNWLKQHRYRDRLTTAVRNWEYARPATDVNGGALPWIRTGAHNYAAVAGQAAIQALLNRQSIRDRLAAILNEVRDDPFAREWRAALASGNAASLRKLFARPEFHQLSSRELSSLVDASLNLQVSFNDTKVLPELLALCYERFPGEYWVNFRIAGLAMLRGSSQAGSADERETIRHLSAAIAARPGSAMPRVALAMTILERKKDEAGLRMLRAAATIDPTSAWPHLMLGFAAMEKENWQEMFAGFRQAAVIDPDFSFFMILSLFRYGFVPNAELVQNLPEGELAGFFDELIAAHPNHSAVYVFRGGLRQDNDDYRAALEDYRKSLRLTADDDIFRAMMTSNLKYLEAMELWRDKLPAVLQGKLRPMNGYEMFQLAEYCAGFERKYVLAARFATDGFAAEPNLYLQFDNTIRAVGWCIKASTGKGLDAHHLSEGERSALRKKALSWLKQIKLKTAKGILPFAADKIWAAHTLAPVREPQSLANLPVDERNDWKEFWANLPKKPELAPMPRTVK